MITFSRRKNRAHIQWKERCWLERGTRMLFLSSFSHFLFPLLQASSLSLSTALSAKCESLPSHLPSVPSLYKPHTWSQHYSSPAVPGRGKQRMAHNHSPQPFPRGDAGAGSATPAGPALRLWPTCFIGQMASLEQLSWRCLLDTLQ